MFTLNLASQFNVSSPNRAKYIVVTIVVLILLILYGVSPSIFIVRDAPITRLNNVTKQKNSQPRFVPDCSAIQARYFLIGIVSDKRKVITLVQQRLSGETFLVVGKSLFDEGVQLISAGLKHAVYRWQGCEFELTVIDD